LSGLGRGGFSGLPGLCPYLVSLFLRDDASLNETIENRLRVGPFGRQLLSNRPWRLKYIDVERQQQGC
jgi:hypothetical protein